MRIATLALIVQNDRVLLGYKKKGVEEISDILNGPGGKVEAGETLETCVIRETEEEIGIILDPHHLTEIACITIYANTVPDFEVHVFRTEHFSGSPQETEKMIPAGWFPFYDLPFERMLESDREWFAKAARGEQFNAHVYYRERAKGFERIEFLPYQKRSPAL